MLPFLVAFLSSASAATLFLQRSGPDGFNLTTPQNSAVYWYLEESADLDHFAAFSMALGDADTTWNLTIDPLVPRRFFVSTGISVYAPRDTDGDYIDDIYELRHHFLNPLDPGDALLLNGSGITYLQEYRLFFGLGSAPPQIYSREVSAFNFGAPMDSAISREVAVFNFGAPAFGTEAHSREISVFNGQGGPAQGGIPEVYSREVSAYNFGAPPFSTEAISRELSVFNGQGGPALGGIPEIYSREVSVFNLGAPVTSLEAISREVSVFNDIQ